MVLITLLSGVLLLSQVSALVKRSPLELLVARQTTGIDPSTIPAQCQSSCTAIIATLNSCVTNACICTNSNGNALEACVNCLVAIEPSTTIISEGQAIINQFDSGCADFPVEPLTLSTPGFASTANTFITSPIVTPAFSTSRLATGTSIPTSATGTGTATGTALPTNTNNPFAKNAAIVISTKSGVVAVTGMVLSAFLTLV